MVTNAESAIFFMIFGLVVIFVVGLSRRNPLYDDYGSEAVPLFLGWFLKTIIIVLLIGSIEYLLAIVFFSREAWKGGHMVKYDYWFHIKGAVVAWFFGAYMHIYEFHRRRSNLYG